MRMVSILDYRGRSFRRMKIPIFLSYPTPFRCRQHHFVDTLTKYLDGRGIAARTLGVTDYDMDSPLRAVRRLMLESSGLITIAFRRTFISEGCSKYESDVDGVIPTSISGKWLSSPWAQIEPAMAYQLGLPILLLRESGVIAEGLLEKGIAGIYLPEFSLQDGASNYLESAEWHSIIGKWEGHVRSVVEKKGSPPQLF
jgi:hypothetical protein